MYTTPNTRFTVGGHTYILRAIGWPTAAFAAAAHRIAEERLRGPNPPHLDVLAADIGQELDCLHGSISLAQPPRTPAGRLTPTLEALRRCLLEPHERTRPMTATRVAQIIKQPTDYRTVRTIGAILRSTVGDPRRAGGTQVWDVPTTIDLITHRTKLRPVT